MSHTSRISLSRSDLFIFLPKINEGWACVKRTVLKVGGGGVNNNNNNSNTGTYWRAHCFRADVSHTAATTVLYMFLTLSVSVDRSKISFRWYTSGKTKTEAKTLADIWQGQVLGVSLRCLLWPQPVCLLPSRNNEMLVKLENMFCPDVTKAACLLSRCGCSDGSLKSDEVTLWRQCKIKWGWVAWTYKCNKFL